MWVRLPPRAPLLKLAEVLPVAGKNRVLSNRECRSSALNGVRAVGDGSARAQRRSEGAQGFFSGLTLFSLLSLFAPRVFHNSFATKRFRALSQYCRGVILQFPFWELFAGHTGCVPPLPILVHPERLLRREPLDTPHRPSILF
jgi:hypothetical protein